MASSGTTSFNLPIDEIIELALQRVGGEPNLGGDIRDALRLLDLTLLDMQNRGLLLYTLQEVEYALTTAQTTVSLSSDTYDITNIIVRRASLDYPIQEFTYQEYLNLPNKYMNGRPQQWALMRGKDTSVLYIWPRSENATDTIRFWKVRQLEDAGALRFNADVSRRYLLAVISGLAYYMAMHRPGMMDRVPTLQMQYEKDLNFALEADRDNTPLRVRPYLGRMR